MSLTYVITPYICQDMEVSRALALQGHVPVSPRVSFGRIAPGSNQAERDAYDRAWRALLRASDCVVLDEYVVGRLPEVELQLELARELGLRVYEWRGVGTFDDDG